MGGACTRSRKLNNLQALHSRGVTALGGPSQRKDTLLDGPLCVVEMSQRTVSCPWFWARPATYLVSVEAFMEAKGTLFILSVPLCFISANGNWAAESSHTRSIHWEIHSPKSKWRSNDAFNLRRHSERFKLQKKMEITLLLHMCPDDGLFFFLARCHTY